MVKENYANAYKEVLIVLNNLAIEDYNKIPQKYIDFFKSNCNNEYDFKYDISKSFEEQDLLDDTKYILFKLFEQFGATNKQKEKINIYRKNYYNKLEKEKREKYNLDNIFKNEQYSISCDSREKGQDKQSIIKQKKQKWYEKIFNLFISFFKK